MAERSLSMREAPGSIPGLSTNTTLQVGGLYSSVGQSARLVSARSGVRTSLEADFLLATFNNANTLSCLGAINFICILSNHDHFLTKILCQMGTKPYIIFTLARTISYYGRARRGSNTRPLDLQSDAIPTAPQAQMMQSNLYVLPM